MNSFSKYLFAPIPIAPLAIFRVLFGFIMLLGTIRFMANEWVKELYIDPTFYFTYFGWEWVQPLGEVGMYLLFGLMALCFLLVAVGLFYRFAIAGAFLSFTYVELIDKANYLNHYYFVSIVLFLMLFVPANGAFSLDSLRNPDLKSSVVPRWTVGIFRLQLALVYWFAGLAKVNPDWLLEAMPLKIWLPAHSHLPIVGQWMGEGWLAYVFSWAGVGFDLSIGLLLFLSISRKWAYLMVVVFHLATYFLFPIGMFPFIMMSATIIFFPGALQEKWLQKFGSMFQWDLEAFSARHQQSTAIPRKITMALLAAFFVLQIAIPMRFLAYPSDLFWHEQGYRFSWRVMLMEKAGYTIFHIFDPVSGRSWEAKNYEFLTPNQEKMMATQPDMILQFAHYLQDHYRAMGLGPVEVRAESFVTLNGRPSKPFIDSTVDLTKVTEGLARKTWILDRNDG